MFQRKSNRLDIPELYKKNNTFFVTIVEAQRRCLFSNIESRGEACEPQSDTQFKEKSSGELHEPPIDIKNKEESLENIRNLNNIVSRASPLHHNLTPQVFNSSTPIGKIIKSNWFYLETLFSDIVLGDFLIMPNHIHFIIELKENPKWKQSAKPILLSNIISALKSKSVTDCKKKGLFDEQTFWQKSYYDHIVRGEDDLLKIRKYIEQNPTKWNLDILNPVNEVKYKKQFNF